MMKAIILSLICLVGAQGAWSQDNSIESLAKKNAKSISKVSVAGMGNFAESANLMSLRDLSRDIVKLDLVLRNSLSEQISDTEKVLDRAMSMNLYTGAFDSDAHLSGYRESLVKYLEARLKALKTSKDQEQFIEKLPAVDQQGIKVIKKALGITVDFSVYTSLDAIAIKVIKHLDESRCYLMGTVSQCSSIF